MVKSDNAIFALALAVFAAAALWMMYVVPMDMDETIQYHRLACWSFEGAKLNTFREGCNAYVSNLLGLEFQRSFSYIGITSSILYAPAYRLMKNIYSVYLLGVALSILFSLLLAHALGLRRRTAVIPLLYFPFLFQMLHDTGPVRVSLLTYPFVIHAVTKIVQNDSRWKDVLFWILAAAFMMSIATEDKPFYIYLLPQVLIIAWACALNNTDVKPISVVSDRQGRQVLIREKFFLWASLFVVLVGVGLSLVLVFTKIGTRPYLFHLRDIRLSTPFAVMSGSYRTSLPEQLSLITEFVFSPVIYAERIYSIPSLYKTISFLCFLPLFVPLARHIQSQKKRLFLWLAVADIALCGILVIMGGARHGHHFIFLHVPILILLMYYANTSRINTVRALGFSICILLVNVALAARSQTHSYTTAARSQIFDFLASPGVAENSVINFSSWGGYSIQALYGHPSQIVTWVDFDSIKAAHSLTDLLDKTGRTAIFDVCTDCSAESIGRFFPSYKIDRVGPTVANWFVWKISKI